MDVPKILAGTLACSHAAFGLNYLVRPREARTSWIGRAAKRPRTQVMVRAQGGRDVALSSGTLRALARGDQRAAGVDRGADVRRRRRPRRHLQRPRRAAEAS